MIAGLEPVTLTLGEVLYEPGDTISHVYFPSASLVSLLTLADGHLALEVGIVGRDGMVGIPLVLGHTTSSVRALVQGEGAALRMKAGIFLKLFRLSPPLQRELSLYIHALMAQISQTAACNRFHVVEPRLARWLLMTHDRMQSSPFRLTQEFLSQMLGVRRVDDVIFQGPAVSEEQNPRPRRGPRVKARGFDLGSGRGERAPRGATRDGGATDDETLARLRVRAPISARPRSASRRRSPPRHVPARSSFPRAHLRRPDAFST